MLEVLIYHICIHNFSKKDKGKINILAYSISVNSFDITENGHNLPILPGGFHKPGMPLSTNI
jgi:hypothetical protein